MAPPQRLACLWVPLFPLAARLRSEPELKGEALAVLTGEGQTARIVAATRLARQAGVRPGMTLSQARALIPKLVARGRDAACEVSAQEALLEVAERFSPRLEDGGAGLAYLDTGGLERHFSQASSGEPATRPPEPPELLLARALILSAEDDGLPLRVGIAGSKLAARVAAGLRAEPTVIPAGEEAAFLAPLPLERLSPGLRLAHTLERWGIHTAGQLANLSEAQISSRLGGEGQALHAIARGLDPQPLMPRQPPVDFREGSALEWPLVALEPFLFIARSALERLSRRLAGCGLACKQLELRLELEPDGHHERSIELPTATRDVKTLLTLVRLELEARVPGAPVTGFVFIAHPDRPRAAQLSLFGPAELSPDALATTLARLFALLGPERVGSPRPRDDHRPETFQLVEFRPPPPPTTPAGTPMPAAAHGLLTVRALRPAVELEVMTATKPATGAPTQGGRTGNGRTGSGRTGNGHPGSNLDDLQLLSLRTSHQDEATRRPRIEGRIRVASGPWSLEEAWWDEAGAAQRDYWDIELSGGGLYRIYRDRSSGDWFADGVYD